MASIPLAEQRWRLTLSSVRLECLNADKQPIPGATASGFVRQEEDGHYLYTCWHVVAFGLDPYSKLFPPQPSTKRHYLRVALQAAESSTPDIVRIGGLQTLDLPLYEELDGRLLPLWLQDEKDTPQVEFNALGLRVPFWHDAVKLKLPSELQISDIQLVDNNRIFGSTGGMVLPGDKVLVVGYPHGFSTTGLEQPTPVVLTRFVAGMSLAGRHRQFLLESIGGNGMSGGPVFIEQEADILLVGLYTGLVYPDNLSKSPEKVTALGIVADITFHLHGHLPFTRPGLPEQ